jgi:hypothetical protein
MVVGGHSILENVGDFEGMRLTICFWKKITMFWWELWRIKD